MCRTGGREGRPYGGLKGRGGEPGGPVWDRPLRRRERAVRIGSSHDIGFSFFMGRTCTVPHAGFPLFVGADIIRPRYWNPVLGEGGYHPPAAPDNIFCRGAQCAPAVPRLSTSPSMWKRWVTPRPGGTSQRAAGRAGAGGREGRPYGGLKGRGGEPDGPVWDRPLRGVRTPRGVRTCTVPHAGVPLFVGADIIRPRYWNHMLGGGGYHPPAAPDNVFCRGAQCAPAVPRLSTSPSMWKRWATPRPEAQPKGTRGVLRRAAARAAHMKGCHEREPSLAGRSGTGPYSGRNAAHRADTFCPAAAPVKHCPLKPV